MIKLITFDLDDTLWAVKPTLIRAEQKLFEWFEEHAPKLAAKADSRALVEQRKSLASERPELMHSVTEWRLEAQRRALTWAGYSAAEAEALNQRAFEEFMHWRNQVTLFDGAQRALAQLSQQFQLGAITNGNADIFQQSVGEHFSFSIRADELGISKPDPAPFNAALQKAGVAAEECLHIGDCPKNDIAPAKVLGMTTVQALLVDRSMAKSPEADASFDHWDSLPALIQRLSEDSAP